MPDGTPRSTPEIDVVIIGAGFAGVAMAIKLQQAGMNSFAIVEKADAPGGTWRDNHYPGAACDIPSHLYSLSFEPKTDWSRMYPGHAELQDYLLGLVAKHGLASKIRYSATMVAATYDEDACLWRVALADGGSLRTRVLISAIGALHEPAIPHLPGIETFEGKSFHSARWDHHYSLAGKSIAVIGTGASAIQFVPQIAKTAGRLHVFQRTAPWINPKKDYPISPRRQWAMKHVPLYRSLLRWRLFWLHEIRVIGFLGRPGVMKAGQKFADSYRERKVKDPELRAKLTPDYVLGCKRVLISNDYYQTFSRGNAELVTAAVATIQSHAIVTQDGTVRAADVIIYGTGFKATDVARYGQIKGLGGASLQEAFLRGAPVFWGIVAEKFPNYFMLLGPNTGLGHNSVVLMIEAQVRYIMSALTQMRAHQIQAIALRPEPAARYAAMLARRMDETVWQKGGCRSWYQDEHGRNTTMWPGSVVEYRMRTRHASLRDFTLVPQKAIHG